MGRKYGSCQKQAWRYKVMHGFYEFEHMFIKGQLKISQDRSLLQKVLRS